MDPAHLIPQALPIPVEWGWFYLFQMLTFVLHLLVMNIMLGMAVIALVHQVRGKAETEPLTVNISRKLPFTVAFAVNFGVAPLLFLQVLYGQFFYTSSVLMAAYWLSVIGLIMLAYASAYYYDFRYAPLGSLRTVFIALSAVCLLTTAFFFTNNMTLMLVPENWLGYFENAGGTMLHLQEPTLIPRYLHMVVSAVAVGGLFLAIVWSFKKNDPQAPRWIAHGLNWYAYATMSQMAFGLWFLWAMPQRVSHLLLGGEVLHTLVFALGAVLGLISISTALQRRVRTTTALLVLTIVFMAFLRDLVRDAYLSPYFEVGRRTVTGEYSPLILFILTLIAGLGVVLWMITTVVKDMKVRS